ncbi:MAG: NosD domain-containing protein [Promethearchaeota archaeon]
MRKFVKEKIIYIIAIFTLFILFPVSFNFIFIAGNSDNKSVYHDKIYLEKKNLDLSKISEKIHIDNNWTTVKTAEICTGEGTYSDPYVIEDLVIDGNGVGSCILIENSNVFFKIVNCTLYNSGPKGKDAGIKLHNVNNSILMNNSCSSNYVGIRLSYCNNNSISGNIGTNSIDSGIFLYFSDNNIIFNNSIFWGRYGISVFISTNVTISHNKMKECGLDLYGDLSSNSINVDPTNLVNEKPVYYYNNKVKLNSSNFTNAGQVILYNCHNSSVSNLNISYGSTGISLNYCSNINITGNIAKHHKVHGISLSESDYVIIWENTLDYNDDIGINLYLSYYNKILKNNASNNWEGICSWACSKNNISGNNLNNNRGYGALLHNSNNNSISGNTVNYNRIGGIYLDSSNNNIISDNVLIGNKRCIIEKECEGNIFINNYCLEVFPFELIVLIISVVAISGIVIVLLIRLKKIR